MKQMSLVKPHRLTGFRMSGDSLTDLTGSEMICASLKLYASYGNKFRPLICYLSERHFPTEIQSFPIVSDIHDLLLDECSLIFGSMRSTFRLSAIGVSPPCATFTQKNQIFIGQLKE